MKIIIDAMGGDNAPTAPVLGAIEASKVFDVEIVLVGQGEVILKTLEENGIKELPQKVEIFHTSEVVEMCDDPATACRQKKDSSMRVGLDMVKRGDGDAFISAGSTGALMSGATLFVKRIRGVVRAALAPVIPSVDGGTLLLDAGANAVCTPEQLLQFAFMGSFYAEQMLDRETPKLALLNIGTEESKGTQLQLDTFPLLQKAAEEKRINFIGNMEAREGMMGVADVIVTDGWTGNIFLKSLEGAGVFVNKSLKEMFLQSLKHKMGALLVADGIRSLKATMDSSTVGGTVLLGVSKPVFKAHGSSNAHAFVNAVKQAKRFVDHEMIEQITDNVEHMTIKS